MKKVPYSPIDAPARDWINYRWAWLCQQFGTKGLKQRPIVLPTPKFFPDVYSGLPDEVETLVHRVARYMEVNPDTLDIHYYEETRNPLATEHQGSAGMYVQNEQGKFEIWLEVTNLNDPERMIATIAHELGHVLLLGQGRLTSVTDDHEPLTDLITIFFGLGAFPANTALHENYCDIGNYSSWTIGKQDYLSMNMFGYAHALLAVTREEERPTWLKDLRLDVRKACQQSLRFLSMHPVDINSSAPVKFPDMKRTPSVETSDEEDNGTDKAICTQCGSPIEPSNDSISHESSKLDICNDCKNDDEQQQEPEELDVKSILGWFFRWQEYLLWLILGFVALLFLLGFLGLI